MGLTEENLKIRSTFKKIQKQKAVIDAIHAENASLRVRFADPHLKRDARQLVFLFNQPLLEVLVNHLPHETIENLMAVLFPLKKHIIDVTPWREGIVRALYDLPKAEALTNDDHQHFVVSQRAHVLAMVGAEISERQKAGGVAKTKQEHAYKIWREGKTLSTLKKEYAEYCDRVEFLKEKHEDSALVDQSNFQNTVLPPLDVWNRFTHLKELFISYTLVSDFSPIQGCINLEQLVLRESLASDLSVLSAFKKLRVLDLNRAKVSDISFLVDLENLGHLLLSETAVVDISPLVGLKKLRTLDLSHTKISNISLLASLESLEDLDLSNTGINNLKFLVRLEKLRTLEISKNQVSDLSLLSGLVNLRDLVVRDTLVSDITPLEGLVNLHFLSLKGTQVSNVTSLASLRNLTGINLSNTRVSDITPLASLGSLRLVFLSVTAISNITSLEGLENLEWVYIQDNVPLWHPLPDEDQVVATARIARNREVVERLKSRGAGFEQ